eukprot:Sspe_Gene.55625::Locus_30583_Transcript_1_1_Confidence_1.000_Length_680::g.55625::m.55625
MTTMVHPMPLCPVPPRRYELTAVEVERCIACLGEDRDVSWDPFQHIEDRVGVPRDFAARDREVVKAAVQRCGCRAWMCADPSRWGDRDTALIAAADDGVVALHLVCPELRQDKDLVLTAVRQSGEALWCADHLLRDDPDVAAAAVTQSRDAVGYVSQSLLRTPQVAAALRARRKSSS